MISNISQVISTSLVKTGESAPVDPTPAGSAVETTQATQVSAAVSSSGVKESGHGATDQALADAIDKLNSKVQNLNRNLEFSLDEESGKVLVKVVDAQTHEILRQIPSEEAVELARRIEQYMQSHHIGLVQAKA